jgi:hypothetical protein
VSGIPSIAAAVGGRRPLNIGIDVDTFRRDSLPEPREQELVGFSRNPRNRFGDWYEHVIEEQLAGICNRGGWSFQKKVHLGYSPIHLGDKIVDVVVSSKAGKIGLELKFLRGEGSLVRPKALIDALDFTHRPIYCIYVIDGPGWLKGGVRRGVSNVEYLAHWWDFTCSAHLEETLTRFFEMSIAQA